MESTRETNTFLRTLKDLGDWVFAIQSYSTKHFYINTHGGAIIKRIASLAEYTE